MKRVRAVMACGSIAMALLSSESSGAPQTRYSPGWLVQLHSAEYRNTYEVDPGDVAAFAAQDSVFDESAFVSQSGLANTEHIIAATASSKFVARAAGNYQFGIRVEPNGGFCWVELWLAGTRVSQSVGNDNRVTVAAVSLSQGLYNTSLDMGCTDGHSKQTTHGRFTLLIERPGELALGPTRQADFIIPGSNIGQLLGKRPPSSSDIPPSEPLPMGTNP